MNKKILLKVLSFTAFTQITLLNCEAENKNCGNEISIIKTEVASAGTWENVRNSPGSLRKESSNLISLGVSSAPGAYFSLTTTPKALLKDSSDQSYCEKKLEESKKKPITFGPRIFKSLEDLQSWVGELSKGSGTDGEKLYDICDKSCSPVYTYNIKEDLVAKKFEASVSALCGLPRDKDDNKYNLELWCGKK